MGWIDNLPAGDYHRSEALGSTSLKTLATRTPAHFKWDQEHPRTSDAFDLGTVVHALALEQDESGVVVVDHPNWMTKAAKEAKAEARDAGKIPLLRDQWEDAKAMRDSILAHPLAGKALTGHVAERSYFWEEDGLKLKCRPDALNHGMIFDLKTTVNADPRHFGKTAHDYGYHQSNAHYVDGVEHLTGERLPFVFILAEKAPPYLVSVVELGPDAVDLGRRLNTHAKNVYRECAAADHWPGYSETEPVRLPHWATRNTEEIFE